MLYIQGGCSLQRYECIRPMWYPHFLQVIQPSRIVNSVISPEIIPQSYKGKNILILSDNISTIAFLNHMCPVRELTQLAKAIWAECMDNNVMIYARHLPGRSNVETDSLSGLQDKYEWRLHPMIFHLLDSMWGPHIVDRFSSFVTTHLPFYNSRYFDSQTCGVDGLAQRNWE